MKINLGYCCVSMLHKELQCNRSSTKTYLEQHDKAFCRDYLIDKAKKNIEDLEQLLKYNKIINIMAFRVPEQILPQVDLGYYCADDLKDELYTVGQVANELSMQLSTHPSQYFVLNSLREDVVERTIHSLNQIAATFERMELSKTPNLTLHLGMKNGYSDSDAAVEAFCINYRRLNRAAQKYLVLENDHVSFDVANCIKVHEQIGIPIVFDNKHYEWNSGDLSYEEAVSKVVTTWGERIPKFHLSSDRNNKKHAHDDYVILEDYERLINAISMTGIHECNVMLECKQKDVAVVELRKKIKESK